VLWTVPPRRILSLLIVGGVPLVFWGLGLHPVLGRLGVSIRLFDSILLYAASGFPNAITPFGQGGGDPVSAVLFRRTIGTDFEIGLVAVGGLNALDRVAAVVLGLLGVGYLGSRVAVGGVLRNAGCCAASGRAGRIGPTRATTRFGGEGSDRRTRRTVSVPRRRVRVERGERPSRFGPHDESIIGGTRALPVCREPS
jgi:hypothetical protein